MSIHTAPTRDKSIIFFFPLIRLPCMRLPASRNRASLPSLRLVSPQSSLSSLHPSIWLVFLIPLKRASLPLTRLVLIAHLTRFSTSGSSGPQYNSHSHSCFLLHVTMSTWIEPWFPLKPHGRTCFTPALCLDLCFWATGSQSYAATTACKSIDVSFTVHLVKLVLPSLMAGGRGIR